MQQSSVVRALRACGPPLVAKQKGNAPNIQFKLDFAVLFVACFVMPLEALLLTVLIPAPQAAQLYRMQRSAAFEAVQPEEEEHCFSQFQRDETDPAASAHA